MLYNSTICEGNPLVIQLWTSFFTVTHSHGQTSHYNGRPRARLRNLLHAWWKLQRYKKIRKGRLNMAHHSLRHKKKHKINHKAKHKKMPKLRHRLKLKSQKKVDKELVSKHGKHDHRHHHHHHHHHHNHHHHKAMSKSHKVKVKEKTIHVHNTTANIKEGRFI